jgi:HPt (histidine-containing phosphotransfer) domain-containing protein
MPDAPDPEPIYSDLLSTDGDLADIVRAFVEELPARISQLSAAHEGGRLEEIRALAQRLKGASRSHGYPDLCDRAAALERTASECSKNAINEIIREINGLVSQIQAGLMREA